MFNSVLFIFAYFLISSFTYFEYDRRQPDYEEMEYGYYLLFGWFMSPLIFSLICYRSVCNYRINRINKNNKDLLKQVEQLEALLRDSPEWDKEHLSLILPILLTNIKHICNSDGIPTSIRNNVLIQLDEIEKEYLTH